MNAWLRPVRVYIHAENGLEDAAWLRLRSACRGLKEEFVQGIRMSWSYEVMTHAITCPGVLGNEPSNVRGRGIRQGRRVGAAGKIRSFTMSKPDQSNPVLNGILHGAFLADASRNDH